MKIIKKIKKLKREKELRRIKNKPYIEIINETIMPSVYDYLLTDKKVNIFEIFKKFLHKEKLNANSNEDIILWPIIINKLLYQTFEKNEMNLLISFIFIDFLEFFKKEENFFVFDNDVHLYTEKTEYSLAMQEVYENINDIIKRLKNVKMIKKKNI